MWRIHELELARARRNKVCRTVLVAERVAADHDRLDPSGYGPWDALEDDRFAEDGATENIADLCTSKGKGRTGERATSAKGAVAKTEREGMQEKERECRNGWTDGRCSELQLAHHRMQIRTVPLGERHICFRLNSSTRASSGVMVAHLIPTLCLRIASADSTVTWSLVCGYSGDGEHLSGGVRTAVKWRSDDAPHRDVQDRDQST